MQILGTTDDTHIVAKTARALKNDFLALEDTVKKIVLRVNEDETKYLRVGGSLRNDLLVLGLLGLQRVDGFVYPERYIARGINKAIVEFRLHGKINVMHSDQRVNISNYILSTLGGDRLGSNWGNATS